MEETQRLVLMLGSNLGDRAALLDEAVSRIAKRLGPVELWSSIYETEAWGEHDQAAFLNALLVINTTAPPLQALKIVLDIEAELGRDRSKGKKGGERTVDIDLLYYGEHVINEKELTIPHPAIAERNFVLVPLTEVLPDFIHPLLKRSSSELLQECPDTLVVKKIKRKLKNAKKVN